jgi:hypothetical protein
LGEVAAALARAGQAGDAVHVAGAILNIGWDHDGWRPRALGEVAVALARAGWAEAAHDTFEAALAAAVSVEDPLKRPQALLEVAAALARAGQAEAALRATKNSVLWGVATWPQAEAEATLRVSLAINHPYWRSRALGEVTEVDTDVNCWEAGETLRGALHAANALPSESERALLLGRIACFQAKARLTDQAIATSSLILTEREKHLPALIESFLQADDRTYFKELLVPCAAHLESAWKVCGLLAGAYPEQSSAIAQVVLPFARKAAEPAAEPTQQPTTPQ